MRRTLVLITALAFASASDLAFAQSVSNDDRCRVMETRQHNGDKRQDSRQAPAVSDSNPSKQLSDCGGVLKPPAVGDGKMEKPAPKVGDTPVIKPRDAPGNQPPSK